MTTATKTPFMLQNSNQASAEQIAIYEKCSVKILSAKIVSESLLICYASKSFFVRSGYDKAGKLKVKQYYRHWNDTDNQPFDFITEQKF